jgi:glycosyltransferase involved in cell wall biosynthesis
MISILIPAHKTQNYIEECLDSIDNQKYLKNVEHEIVVGVDNCDETLKKLLQIRNKYKCLKIIRMKQNYGLFITLNTLLTQAKYENIIKFDSDDIMLPTLIEEVMSIDADLVRFKFFMYFNKNTPIRKFHAHANGVYRIKKTVFDVFGGYQPWLCAADTEFLQRFRQYGKFKEVSLNKELFLYRQHNESLTRKIPFSSNSLRLKYHAMFRGKTYNNFMIEPVTGEYDMILVKR